MVTQGTTILCYASYEPSWMRFGDEIIVQYQGISGDSDEIISTQWMH